MENTGTINEVFDKEKQGEEVFYKKILIYLKFMVNDVLTMGGRSMGKKMLEK